MTVGELIAAARKHAGMTQKELGEAIGMSYQNISQWERGFRNPKLGSLEKIATALHINIDELLPHSIEISDSEADRRAKAYKEIMKLLDSMNIECVCEVEKRVKEMAFYYLYKL